jgi:hypothetical protein
MSIQNLNQWACSRPGNMPPDFYSVMAGLDPAIHAIKCGLAASFVDGRVEPGHAG